MQPASPAPAARPAGRLTKLTGRQFGQLQEALLAAFDNDTLTQMVTIHLEETLANIAGRGTFPSVVFELITWAQREGKLDRLLKGALTANPDSPDLQAVSQALRTDPAQVTLVEEAHETIHLVKGWRLRARSVGSDTRREKTKEPVAGNPPEPATVGTRTSAIFSPPNEPRAVMPQGNVLPRERPNPAGKEPARANIPTIESLSVTIAEAAGHFERLSHLAKLIKAIDGLIIKHVPMCARFVGEYTPRCAALLARPDDYRNFADSLRDATGTLRNNLVEDVMLTSLQDVKFLEPAHKAIVNQIAQSVQLALAELESIDQLCSLVAYPTLETANIEEIGQALQQLAQHNADLDRLNILHKARTPIFVEVDKTVVRIEDVVKRLKKDIRTSKSKAGSAIRQAS